MDIRKPNRVSRTFTQRLCAPPSQVFPLLCPVREAEWLEHWAPLTVLTHSGAAEPDCVFSTPASPRNALWYITRHEPQAGFVEMLKVTPEVTACRLQIRLHGTPAGCEASITYLHTSLGSRAMRSSRPSRRSTTSNSCGTGKPGSTTTCAPACGWREEWCRLRPCIQDGHVPASRNSPGLRAFPQHAALLSPASVSSHRPPETASTTGATPRRTGTARDDLQLPAGWASASRTSAPCRGRTGWDTRDPGAPPAGIGLESSRNSEARRRLLADMLQVKARGWQVVDLDKATWVAILRAAGMNEAAMDAWHREFEQRAPEAHHAFLLSLGLPEEEARRSGTRPRNSEGTRPER